MPLTDYKFWYIRRDDDGFITDVGIRFYEGKIAQVELEGIGGIRRTETRYVRTARLGEKQLKHLGKGFAKERSGNDVKVYTADDFGRIKTDDELRAFLDVQIKRDTKRTPHLVQE